MMMMMMMMMMMTMTMVLTMTMTMTMTSIRNFCFVNRATRYSAHSALGEAMLGLISLKGDSFMMISIMMNIKGDEY